MGAGELLTLLRERPRTRAELLDATGLSRSTLAVRLETLAAHGLIRTEPRTSTGGRPAAVLSFNARAGAILVADVDSKARLAVTDLGGGVLAETSEHVDLAAGPDALVESLADHFDALRAQAGTSQAQVRALAVGFPAPVRFAAGSLAGSTAIPGWDFFPLADALAARFGTRVLVDNDVNLITLGEHAAAWPQVDDLVFVKMARGIGAGVLSGGRIQRGAQGSAGDIGHIRVSGYGDRPCFCGGTGCLGTVASGMGVVRRLREAGVEAASVDDVIARVRAGVPEAIRIVREAGRATGSVLAATVNLLNPSVVVVGGELAAVGEQMLAGIREEIYALATAHATHELRITPSQAGPRAGVIGGSALATAELLAPDAVDRAMDAPARAVV